MKKKKKKNRKNHHLGSLRDFHAIWAKGEGGEKSGGWKTLNGNQPAAHKEPTFLAGVADGKENSLTAGRGNALEKMKNAAVNREGSKCEIAADASAGIQEYSTPLSLSVAEYSPRSECFSSCVSTRRWTRETGVAFVVPLSENVCHGEQKLQILRRSSISRCFNVGIFDGVEACSLNSSTNSTLKESDV